MKVVMYHYVRPEGGLPHFAYLHLDDFRRQLDCFAAKWGFVGRDAFYAWLEGGEAPRGVLLTFDDGLLDQVQFVLPVLRERGLFALFYVPTRPFEDGSVLDVHKVHLALGRLGGQASLAWLKSHAPTAVWAATAENNLLTHYATQHSDDATKQVKQLFNWVLAPQDRRLLLDGLLDHAFRGAPPTVREVYFDETGLRSLVDEGMGVGPHGHDHLVLSQLDTDVQVADIRTSCDVIERLGGSRRWGFCYPFGTRRAFDGRAEATVAEAGCPFAFAVEDRDIGVPLSEAPRFALPRHNCNSFPYGAASFGASENRELAG